MTNLSPEIQQLFSLKGLNALVIGGTGVLGQSLSQTLALAGAHTVIAGRNQAAGTACVQAIRESQGSAEFFQVDLTQPKEIEALKEQFVTNQREVHILVNGAGVNSDTPFLEIKAEEWDQIFQVNLSSIRNLTQIFGKYMIDQQTAGSIINIASVSGLKPLSRVFTYSASKAAVINLTQNLACEWAPYGIRVNALTPGFFPAKQNQKILTKDRVEKILAHTPLNRFGEPQELSGALLLLASPVAGKFITGSNLVVDGGFSVQTI